MTPDDRRLAKASRLLRRRYRLRQSDLPSRHVAQLIEAGRAGELRLNDLRAHFARLEGSIFVNAWWQGAALDRLADSRHATVIEASLRVLRRDGWRPLTEVTFSEFGERGSIDVFAAHDEARAVLVGEAKSEWGSIEETLRRLHVKTRLAPNLAVREFGWRPKVVGCVLIFPEDRTARRVADRFSETLNAAFPARGRAIRSWLRAPSGDLRGIWFLTDAGMDRASRM